MAATDSIVVSRAEERMANAYSRLPEQFFDAKDGSSYRFNNIETLLDRLPATEIAFDEVQANEAAGAVTLYAGVPWCEKICSFCNFAYSTSASPEKHSAYLDRLQREAARFFDSANAEVRSIYFGGGTPTYLEPDLFRRHMTQLQTVVPTIAGTSITCEFSTSTVTAEKLAIMAEAGVTRVSTGLQSLDAETRKRANLAGEGAEALAAVELAAQAFNNFNVDLIYGHPYQSHGDWIKTVSALASAAVPSITLYRLELKTRTTFKKIYQRDSRELTDEGRARLHYFIAREILEHHGYVESPLGWWVKRSSLQQNPTWLDYLHVWKNATPYLGLGQGAFSVGRAFHWRNEAMGKNWESKVDAGQVPAAVVKRMPQIVVTLNQFMRHVRTTRVFDLGVVRDDFAAHGALAPLETTIQECLDWGLVTDCGAGSHQLTEAGESLIHWVFGDLVDRVGNALLTDQVAADPAYRRTPAAVA